MATIIDVPINTMLADLDESLKALLKRELDRLGFDGVEIEFDTPDRAWAAALSSPAVNLFLHDIREAKEFRPVDWEQRPGPGGSSPIELRPPLRVEASYTVTAWTPNVQDEHRLLSQTMAALYAFPMLPADVLTASLANGSQRYPLKTRTAQERHEDASDFWSAVGGQYKASFNYVVTLSCEAGTVIERGPEARTARGFDPDTRNATLLEMHRSGGVVLDGDGKGIRNVWVHLQETGQLAVTDSEGRFRFDRLSPGEYTVRARGPEGEEGKTTMTIPGLGAEITLSANATSKR
jgi:hypothetical protein